MADDIVERLRSGPTGDGWYYLYADEEDAINEAADLIEAQQAEIERLTRWKSEAVEVLKEWDALASLVEARLGDRKSDAVAAEIERLRAERDDLQVLLTGRTAEFQAEIERLRGKRNAEKVLADQLADALRAVAHDRPSAHTDDVWTKVLAARAAYEEARRG